MTPSPPFFVSPALLWLKSKAAFLLLPTLAYERLFCSLRFLPP